MTESKTYTLRRSGEAPLRISGVLVADSDGQWCNGQEQNRWHDIAVYRPNSDPDQFIIHIIYNTKWQGELGRSTVLFTKDVADALYSMYLPTDFLVGYPPDEQFAEKQRRLEDSLTRRWEEQVSDICEQMGAVEERL